MVKIGDAVIFVDRYGRRRSALVTAVWGQYATPQSPAPGVNVVLVSDDPAKDDSYGRQIERETSVVHQSNQVAHGNYWRTVSDDTPLTPYKEPVEGFER
jgi:hypothetical protein